MCSSHVDLSFPGLCEGLCIKHLLYDYSTIESKVYSDGTAGSTT